MNEDEALEKLYRLKSITHGVKYREELQEVIDWIREEKMTEPNPMKIETAKKEKRVICPHCGVAGLDDEPITKKGKLGYKFSLLLENDRNKMAVFLCDDCGEMFQLPTSYYIRIVRGE